MYKPGSFSFHYRVIISTPSHRVKEYQLEINFDTYNLYAGITYYKIKVVFFKL